MLSYNLPFLDKDHFLKKIESGINDILFLANGSDKLASVIYEEIYSNLIYGHSFALYQIKGEINEHYEVRIQMLEQEIKRLNEQIDLLKFR